MSGELRRSRSPRARRAEAVEPDCVPCVPVPPPAPARLRRGQPAQAAPLELSHIVYEVPNLPNACKVFKDLTGVQPLLGGKNEALGLQNAIVGLGGSRYLELLARTTSSGGRRRQHDTDIPVTQLSLESTRPHLLTWCCDASRAGLTGLVSELSQSPQKHMFPAEIALMAGLTEEGQRITWREAADKHRGSTSSLPMGGTVPLLRDWPKEQAFNPGLLAPAGCELIELKAQHPEPEVLTSALQSMRAAHLISVEQTDRPRLSAIVRHAYGQLVLE